MTAKSAYTGPLSPEYALLGLLAQGAAHGYELHQRLTLDLGQVWHLSLSQAYNILNRLESQGYVAAEVHEQDKLPARRLLRLTPLGKERFEGWLSATSATSVRAIRLEFLTRLYFARARGVELAHQIIAAQHEEARAGLERLRRLYREIPADQLTNRLSVELRTRQLESILEWLEMCHQAIESKPTPDQKKAARTMQATQYDLSQRHKGAKKI